jgi:hypothetical protein
MKTILAKIPKFIYSLFVLNLILIYFSIFILNNFDSDNGYYKFLFTIIIFLITLTLIPIVQTLLLLLEEERYDLRFEFRKFFGINFTFSIFLLIFLNLKIFGFLNFTTFVGFILIYLGIRFGYQKLRKPRRIRHY